MRIAILGTRGVPPRYGGFETFAAELGKRLVARGHEVFVYCRPPVILSVSEGPGRAGGALNEPTRATRAPRSLAHARDDNEWEGIHCIVLPAIRHKYFETVSHAALSALDALRRRFDVVLVCNAANAFVLPLLRAARIPAAINVDGIERRRRKWNLVGRSVYAIGETFSARFADAVVADAEVIAAYYRERHGVDPIVIPYGSEFPEERDSDVVERLGIVDDGTGEYVLYVSRFEPENNPLEVVLAYEKLRDAPPLVMVGSAPYSSDLIAELHRHASSRILFPGGLYDRDYRTLQRRATVYVQATEVGGTHPALIEAMGSGGCVVALDTPENREVGGDAVGYFTLRPTENLSGKLRDCLASAPLRERMREAARQRAAERYSWETVTGAYEQLFSRLAR
jgi:glycosyltransferase involved in cell wall biosynthesis